MSRDYVGRFLVDETDGTFVDLGNILEMCRLNNGDWQLLYHGGGKWSTLPARRGDDVFAALLAYRREHP